MGGALMQLSPAEFAKGDLGRSADMRQGDLEHQHGMIVCKAQSRANR
jgi:hypothetical protein